MKPVMNWEQRLTWSFENLIFFSNTDELVTTTNILVIAIPIGVCLLLLIVTAAVAIVYCKKKKKLCFSVSMVFLQL